MAAPVFALTIDPSKVLATPCGLPEVTFGDQLECSLTLTGDTRSGAAGYSPAVVIGQPGITWASGESFVAGSGKWTFVLRLNTTVLGDEIRYASKLSALLQILVTEDATGRAITEGRTPITIYRGVYDGPLSPLPTYYGILDAAISAEASARISADESIALLIGTGGGGEPGLAGAAIDVSFSPTGTIAATNVQSALAEVASERVVADVSLASRISSEESVRASAAASLSTRISTEESDTVSLSTRISTEESVRASVDSLRVAKDAGGNTESLNTVRFTVSHVDQPYSEGLVHWNPDDHCLEADVGEGVTLQIGQETLMRVRNATGSTLLNGKAVYITGSTGTRPTVALADNTVSDSAHKTLGLLTADIANNADGWACTSGLVRDLNTSAFADGATVYLSTAGGLTITPPASPNEVIRVGHIVRSHVTLGVVLVHVQHSQDASEVGTTSIAALPGATVQAMLSSAASVDASISAALSSAISSRISAEASLTTRISSEESTRASVDASISTVVSGLAVGAIGPDLAAIEALTGTGYLERLGDGLYQLSTPSGGSGGGTKTYAVFSALDFQPPASLYAIFDTRNSIAVLNFSDSAIWSAFAVGVMPEAAVLTSGLKVRLHWLGITATSGNVQWRVEFERMNTDLDSDSFDTAVEATAACNGTSGIETVTEITVTTIDGITAGDLYRLRVSRVGSDATNDTMSGYAQLAGIEIRGAA